MNSFNQILAALGAPAGGPWHIGDDPPLTVTYNAGTQVLVIALNEGVHMTIFKSSWDAVANIQDCTGDRVDVGPYCLHTTAGDERWFRQHEHDAWAWVTDCGTPTRRYLLAIDAMMRTLGPYLGAKHRVRRRRAAPVGAPQENRIAIGAITSTNPWLWVSALTLGQPDTEYTIATVSPPGNFINVNQFCSILSIRWLSGGRGTSPYGIGDFSDREKRAMAETLIGYRDMEDQIVYAEAQLGGQRRSLEEVAAGVAGGGYDVGTKIWAGNDFHVIAVYVKSASEYEIYDSNTGRTTARPRSGFRRAMEQLGCDAFVVA